jgi:hypothetical protein
MAAGGAHSVGSRGDRADAGVGRTQDKHGRTPAQWYCLLAGLGLLLAGIFGFFADSTFDTGSTPDPEGGNVDGALQGDSFLGFEVNGWHNIVHLLSGLLLLAAFRKRKSAKTVALAFGIVYGLVALIGLIDGNDVLGFIPINPADNILHLALSALGIISALLSRGDDHDKLHTSTSDAGHRTTGRRVDTADVVRDRDTVATDRSQRFDRGTGTELDPRDLNPHDGDGVDPRGTGTTERRTL